MARKTNIKMDASPFENKAERLFSNKVVVIKPHDGLEVGYVVKDSTPEIINMMIEKGYWGYANSEDR